MTNPTYEKEERRFNRFVNSFDYESYIRDNYVIEKLESQPACYISLFKEIAWNICKYMNVEPYEHNKEGKSYLNIVVEKLEETYLNLIK